MSRSTSYHTPDHQPDTAPEPEIHTDEPAPACPGKCNAAYRAAERRIQLHGGEHDLEPWPGEPVWCLPCVNDIRGAIEEWPDLAQRLREEIGAGVKTRLGEHVSGSKSRPIHEHEAPSLLLDEMAEWLPEWASSIAVHRRLAPRAGARRNADPVEQIAAACHFMLPHLTWHLAERPTEEREIAEDFGRLLLKNTRKARALTGTQEPEPIRVVGVPCPHCDRKALEYEVEDNAARKASVTRYVYGEDGEVCIGTRPADDGEVALLRLWPPKGADPDEPFEPTVPIHVTEKTAAFMAGANTGYIRCRRCKPTFRMTLDEYRQWTRMLAAGEQVRMMTTADKLREVFGSSVPAQYRVKP